MTAKGSIFFLFIHFSQLTFGQNYILNGNFETVGTCPVNMPENGIVATSPWYTVGDPLFVTPDLFHQNCPLSAQRAAVSQFWGKQFLPYEGEGFMGLGSAVSVNEVFVSEGAATPLAEPLTGGRAYYFEMQVRNKGIDYIDNPASKDCEVAPKKFIGIYLSDDTISQTREVSNNTITDTYSTSRLIFADSTAEVNSSFITDWHRYSDCFIATGGESHLGIIGPLGKIQTVSSPCVVSNQQIGFFHQSYYDIDNILLLEIPTELTAGATICEAEPTTVRLRQLLSMPMFDKAVFRWEDGSIDSARAVQKEGLYEIEVILPCVTIPLYLTITAEDCATNIYAPTGFSPNGDGINDGFKPVMTAFWEVLSYKLNIYNRWGNLVFSTNDSSESWSGNDHSSGVYAWTLEYQLGDGKNSGRKIQSGSITLIR